MTTASRGTLYITLRVVLLLTLVVAPGCNAVFAALPSSSDVRRLPEFDAGEQRLVAPWSPSVLAENGAKPGAFEAEAGAPKVEGRGAFEGWRRRALASPRLPAPRPATSPSLTAPTLASAARDRSYDARTPLRVSRAGGATETGGEASDLSKGAKGKLGGLVDQADEKAMDVLKSRGGGGKNVKGGGLQESLGQETLGDLAEKAAKGDSQAEKWIKMIKQAGKQGKGGK